MHDTCAPARTLALRHWGCWLAGLYAMAATSALAQDAQSVGFIGDLSGGCATAADASGVKNLFVDVANQREIEVNVADSGCDPRLAFNSVERLVSDQVDFVFAFTASPRIGEVLKSKTSELGLFAIVFVAAQPDEGRHAALAAAGAWSDVRRRFGDDSLSNQFPEVNTYLQQMFWSRYASN